MDLGGGPAELPHRGVKVLLVNPFVERMHLELSFAENFRPPLGLAYLAGTLKRAGHEVAILDALVLRVRFPALRKLLARERPELVGISSYSPTRYECFRTAQVVKEVLGPAVPVVLGGPHASAVPEDTLREVAPVDYVVRGEADEAFLELVEVLEAGGDPLRVLGVSGRREGALHSAPDRPNVAVLDALPRPARHLLPMKRYGTRMPSTMRRSTTILTSRGCPARCTFCTRDWFSRDTRFHSPAYMADEVEEVVRKHGFRAFIVQDDTFTLDRERVHGFCEELRRRALSVSWLATTRVDCVDLELLEAMRGAGCRVVTFGIESMHQPTLRWLKKGFTVEKVRRAVDWANEAGLIVRGTYLVGIGDETEEEIRDSLALARELPLAKLKANVGLSLYPGTPLFPMAVEAGVIPADYSYARGWQDPEKRYGNGETPRWYTPHVPLERLMELRRETELNALFTRPTRSVALHRARKLAGRLRRHPVESARYLARFARARLTGSSLRAAPVSVTDH